MIWALSIFDWFFFLKVADWPVYTASYNPTWLSLATHCQCDRPFATVMDHCLGTLDDGFDVAAVADVVASLPVVPQRPNGDAVCDT